MTKPAANKRNPSRSPRTAKTSRTTPATKTAGKARRQDIGATSTRTGRKWIGFGGAGLAIAAVVVGLGMTHHAGPLNAAFSPAARTAPLVQQDGTTLHTAEGLANSSTLLVKFKSNVPASSVAAVHRQLGGSVKRSLAGIGAQEVALPAGSSLGAVLKQYRGRSEVAYAEPNFVAQRFMAPDDSLYGKQWNLAKINAPAAWDVSQGGYGPIAVLDSGIDASHADLSGEIGQGYNALDGSSNTNDDNGHGTHVAGIIAATTNNATGVASIGYKGSLMPVKVLDSSGAGTYADLASGITYAADHGARIINMSLGGSSDSQTLQSAVDYAQQKGVILVAAAGNNGNNAAVYPAACNGVIAVSATASDDTLASFSSYGSDVTVGAPGVGIVSTYAGGGYATMSGTSMASPEVAGLLGLALSKAPLSGGDLLNDLRQSSDKVGPYPYDSNGWNQYFGYGRVDAAKLLQLAANANTASTPATPDSPQHQADVTVGGGQTAGPAAHGQAGAQFSVDFEGVVDSTNLAQGVVMVKVQSVSQNLKLASNNIIDLYVTDSTALHGSGNQSLALAGLQPGQKIGGKALWQDNQLSATTITVQGQPAAAVGQPDTGSHAANGLSHRR